MKTTTISLFLKMACVASVLTVVACSGSASENKAPSAKTSSAASTTAAPAGDEEGADRVICSVHADCDSDERCDNGTCVGLDGDKD